MDMPNGMSEVLWAHTLDLRPEIENVHVHVMHASLSNFVNLFGTRRKVLDTWISAGLNICSHICPSVLRPAANKASPPRMARRAHLAFLPCVRKYSQGARAGAIGHERRLACSVSTLERGAMALEACA
jgi:hypothetical protein